MYRSVSITAPRVRWNTMLSDNLFGAAAAHAIRHELCTGHYDVILVNQLLCDLRPSVYEHVTPLVYIVHHPVEIDANLARMESETIRQRFPWAVMYLGAVSAQRQAICAADAIVTVSDSVRQYIEKRYTIPGIVAVIPNGIDTDFFHPLSRTSGTPMILSTGSLLHPRKGFQYLLAVYHLLSHEGFRIVDVGRRSSEQERALRDIPGIEVHGVIEREQLAELYGEASVTLSTTLYEGFGLALTESISCGTPVVAFEGGATEETLKPLTGYRIVPARDVDGMVDAVHAILASRQDPTTLHDIVAKTYPRTLMAERYDRFLAGITS